VNAHGYGVVITTALNAPPPNRTTTVTTPVSSIRTLNGNNQLTRSEIKLHPDNRNGLGLEMVGLDKYLMLIYFRQKKTDLNKAGSALTYYGGGQIISCQSLNNQQKNYTNLTRKLQHLFVII